MNYSVSSSSSSSSSLSDQLHLLGKAEVFKLHGRDRAGRNVFLIVGKHFPARFVSTQAVNLYLKDKIFPFLKDGPFTLVYIHTDVHWTENFPGISNLKAIYEFIPTTIKNNLKAVYFVHPSLQARLFFATVGRLILGAELYNKVKYVKRVEFLWEYVRRKEIELPEFVYDYDEKLEFCPVMDSGLESDYLRLFSASPSVDSAVSTYSSMRCFA
ncbi:Protein GDAP2-like protein, partial [Cucurbita argyrosperma subsp. argyrosperma]